METGNALSVIKSGRQKELAWCTGCASWSKVDCWSKPGFGERLDIAWEKSVGLLVGR